MRRRDLSNVLFSSAALSVLDAQRAEAQICATPCFARTQAEILAGVIPTSTAYAQGNVFRYGAVGDGVTNDAPAFQQAINVVRNSGGTVFVPMPSVAFLLATPLNCTTNTGQPTRGFTFRGDTNVIAVTNHAPYYPAIIAKHTGHVFDCSGSYGINFYDLNIGTDTATTPQTCFFLARSMVGNSQIFRFTNVRVLGSFTKSVVYNYGSEDPVFVGCEFYNYSTAPGTKVITITSTNIFRLASTFISIASGVQSCIDHNFFGCVFLNNSTDSAADLFYFDYTAYVKVTNCWMCMAGGRSLVYHDGTNGPSQLCQFIGITVESISAQRYGYYFDNHQCTPSGWRIESTIIQCTTKWLIAGPLVTLDSFWIGQVIEFQDRGISVPGTLQNSWVFYYGLITIGTSVSNTLVGAPNKWTIITRTADNWIDTTTNKTWSANTSALSVSGGFTTNRGIVTYHGRLVTVNLTLAAGTSIRCAQGTQIAGLPVASTDYSASVQVMNLSTGAFVGNGYVTGSSVSLPTINVATDSICVTATYFAA
jgi:hypothetical protein